MGTNLRRMSISDGCAIAEYQQIYSVPIVTLSHVIMLWHIP